MINQILAEYCSCTTPEMRIRDIFGQIESLMDNERFQAITAPSDSIFTIRSALDLQIQSIHPLYNRTGIETAKII
jgi:hypothetical protein